ncbi:hypothetical protein MLD38_033886 [Melastoma candidum]|uniref:Uncharacterized protein n=1 Tax=Melastoma candidum TaxID=119954 RepID=A0ACB9M9J4_9MYRT|nr:hypothetical protein MLD38_033886 [Melastoma candidum]
MLHSRERIQRLRRWGRRREEGSGCGCEGSGGVHCDTAMRVNLRALHPAPYSVCYGLRMLACERECSLGEDYCLIKLSILDFQTKQEQDMIVECKGHDAARFQNADHAHG